MRREARVPRWILRPRTHRCPTRRLWPSRSSRHRGRRPARRREKAPPETWPGSFMRLAVEIDPVQNEGPIAIELASARRLAQAAGPHPFLGTVFEAEA